MRGKVAFGALARPRDHGGSRRSSGPLSVAYVPPTSITPPAVAFAISRKVGGAVVRNRLRRRLRAELGLLAGANALRPGSYLVGLRPEAAALDGAELRSHLRRALGVNPDAGVTA